mgnify:CR=1 FL=1
MKLFKLTNLDGLTKKNTQWGDNVTVSLPKKENPRLCTSVVIHAYKDINLACLLNPIHGDYNPYRIFEAEGEIVVEDWGKCGCFSLTTISEIEKPDWVSGGKEMEIKIMFAILCAEEVLHFFENQFPSDKRPRKAIKAAKKYLKNKTADAAFAAARAADAAFAAADAAHAVADAADAAFAAARAARAKINFPEIAIKAISLLMDNMAIKRRKRSPGDAQ